MLLRANKIPNYLRDFVNKISTYAIQAKRPIFRKKLVPIRRIFLFILIVSSSELSAQSFRNHLHFYPFQTLSSSVMLKYDLIKVEKSVSFSPLIRLQLRDEIEADIKPNLLRRQNYRSIRLGMNFQKLLGNSLNNYPFISCGGGIHLYRYADIQEVVDNDLFLQTIKRGAYAYLPFMMGYHLRIEGRYFMETSTGFEFRIGSWNTPRQFNLLTQPFHPSGQVLRFRLQLSFGIEL